MWCQVSDSAGLHTVAHQSEGQCSLVIQVELSVCTDLVDLSLNCPPSKPKRTKLFKIHNSKIKYSDP